MNDGALFGLAGVGVLCLIAGGCLMDSSLEEGSKRGERIARLLLVAGLLHAAPGVFALWSRALLG